MKRVFLSLLFALTTIFLSATVVIDETFAVADNITNLADATDWTTTGTLTTGDGRVILSTPLEYSNTGGEYVLSGEGKAVQNIYTEGTNYIAYKQITKVNSGVVYMSYLYKGDGNQGQSQSEIIGLANGTSNSSVKAWAGKQADQTKNPFRLGVTRISTSGSDIQWCDAPTIEANTVTLVVLKYDFDTQAASLFINPTIGSTEEPTANAIDSDKGTAKTSLAYLMFKHNGKSVANFTVGGVRVSTTWAEAVAKKSDAVLPALATPVAGAASAIGAEEFTANWATVENAIGYKVKVYAGENEIALQSVMGQAAVSATFANMPIATELTYTVTAVGDGVAYDDSEESAASAAFSTLAAPAAVVFNPLAAEWAEFACDKGAYSTGSFPSARVNGYDFSGSYIEVSKDEDGKSFSITCEETGERFTARAMLDKNTNSGSLTFPAVASAARVDMYITAGTADKKYKVQQYNYSTGNWADLQEIAAPKSPVAMVSVTPNEGVAKLRIANDDGSAKQIWKVVTYAAAPVDLAVPEALDAANVNAHSFTAHWRTVADASGYRIVVYKNDGTIKKVNVTEAEATTCNVAGLDAGTDYTYKVAAIGDNESYVDSYLSDAIAVTTAAEISDSYTRSVTNGNYGTICLPKASADLSTAGAVFYEVAGKIMEGGKLKQVVFDEVTELAAGVPYVFQATASELNIPLTGDAVADPDNSSSNGLVGSFTVTKVSSSVYKFILSNNLLYCTKDNEYYVGENRAYLDISSMSKFSGESPAPGRRRAYMTTEENQTATSIDNTPATNKATKQMIDGKIIIIRNGEKFDLTGQRL